jgi:hypothetical protein
MLYDPLGVDMNKPKPPTQHSLASFLELTLQGMSFGSVEITIHNANIVQIERREKFRPEDSRFPARCVKTWS